MQNKKVQFAPILEHQKLNNERLICPIFRAKMNADIDKSTNQKYPNMRAFLVHPVTVNTATTGER